jgi:hypothetical protein
MFYDDEDGLLLGFCAVMMEAASTSEMSVNFYGTTWRNNPEDSHFHTRRRENLKSHMFNENRTINVWELDT